MIAQYIASPFQV